MQQGAGSQYGVSPEMAPFTATTSTSSSRSHILGGTDHLQQQLQKSGDATLTVEAASPISSRPPLPAASTGNFEELVPAGNFPDDESIGGEEGERGVTGGNRWPRQETLALLKIRLEMDAAFRDATLKGPLWEDVSRKLAELGYTRSAKKCKEKFENVHKYYKRTKEGRGGRQDGKSYRFFNQLEALHSTSIPTPAAMPAPTITITTATAPSTTNSAAAPVSLRIGSSSNTMGGSSGMTQPILASASPAVAGITTQIGVSGIAPSDLSAGGAYGVISGSAAPATTTAGISFSSSTSSSSSDSEDDFEVGPSNTDSRKRKRGSRRGRSSSSSSRKMMAFFEGLMKHVMEKQEAMQQRFLETIEKREQDRMIREEAWKRQEMARLTREHEIMAQERAISASRDAAVIAFLQQITGQTIQLPTTVTIPAAPPPQSPPTPPSPPAQPQQQQQQQQHQHKQQHRQQQLHHQQPYPQNTETIRHHPVVSAEIVMAVPEQQQPPLAQETGSGGSGGNFDASSSSRWPKTEVLALIKLRSGLESRYQEAGPKGPLWEEISAGMQRMGYNRSSKRCKEKWENINKYFKKVKESKKKRPEDAKTCPYFHELDALYRKKIVGSSFSNQNRQQPPAPQPETATTIDANPTTINTQQRSDVLAIMPPPSTIQTNISEKKNSNNNKNGGGQTDVPTSNGGLPLSFFEEVSSGPGGVAAKKPEDIVKELIKQQQQQQQQQSVMDDYDNLEEPDSDKNLDQGEEDEYDEVDDEDDVDVEEEEEEEEEEAEKERRKMAYKIEFERQNARGSSSSSSNVRGTSTAPASFLSMVQ